jgi:hypothetical protein
VDLCLYFVALFFSDGDTESSGFQWNPESTVFYFVEANKKNPADSGFHWNMADSIQ